VEGSRETRMGRVKRRRDKKLTEADSESEVGGQIRRDKE
jgi:hypothetical protein